MARMWRGLGWLIIAAVAGVILGLVLWAVVDLGALAVDAAR